MLPNVKHIFYVPYDHSVSEIAYALGFENPPYFSRLFKKEVGITPNEFRSKLA